MKQLKNTKINLEPYEEISKYFGKSKCWLTASQVHKKFIYHKYGIVSIATVSQYLDYQEYLRNSFITIYEQNLLDKTLLSKILFKGRRGEIPRQSLISFYNRMFYFREDFMFMRHILKLEEILDKLRDKQSLINTILKD